MEANPTADVTINLTAMLTLTLSTATPTHAAVLLSVLVFMLHTRRSGTADDTLALC